MASEISVGVLLMGKGIDLMGMRICHLATIASCDIQNVCYSNKKICSATHSKHTGSRNWNKLSK